MRRVLSGQAGGVQQRTGVPARRDETERRACVPQPFQQGRRAGEGPHPLDGQQLEEELVLVRGEAMDRPVAGLVLAPAERELDPPCGEEGDDAVLTPAAVHVAPVVLDDVERCLRTVRARSRIGEHVVEQALPGRCMQRGRVGDDAVHVEEHRVVRRLHGRAAS